MIKTFLRKPLYLILYTILILLGFLGLSKVNENIKSDKNEYKYIYENTEIKGQVKEATSISGEVRLDYYDLYPMFLQEEIQEIYTRAFAKGFMDIDKIVKPTNTYEDGGVDVFASNNVGKLIERNFVSYDGDTKLKKGEALVSKDFAEKYGLKKSDKFRLKIAIESKEDIYMDLFVKDFVNLDQSVLALDSVIVNNKTMFDDNLMKNSFYKDSYGFYLGFHFKINPKYNNDYERIKEKIDKILGKKYLAPTNAKDFYNVIKPLEEKIKDEEKLFFIIKIALVILSSLVLFLKVRDEHNSILVRKIFGESEGKVFVSYFLGLGFLILLINILSFIFVNVLAYISTKDIVVNLLVNLIVVAICLLIVTYKDIFILYQKTED